MRVGGFRGIGTGSQFTFGSQLLLGPAATLGKRIDDACEYSDEPRVCTETFDGSLVVKFVSRSR